MNKENTWKKIETNPTWDFREEPELIGFFIDSKAEVGPNKSNIYNFKKENGEVIAVWGNTILDSRFQNLEVGDEVKIVYLGKVQSPKTGREYNSFDVFHRKAEFKDINEEEIPIVNEEN